MLETNLVHVGENKESQLLSHVHGVHGKVVLEPGDGDESVQLDGDGRRMLLDPSGSGGTASDI